MAAKKAPAKKMAAPKPPAPKKPVNRTDKTGASGMGMNVGGVKARATSAGLNKGATLYPQGIGQSDTYSGLTQWMGYKGSPSVKGKKITDKQASKLMSSAENKVNKKYGVTPKKK